MVNKLMLNSRYITTKTDFMGHFLNLKEEQGNEFTSHGQTKANIITIVTKGSIRMWTACPHKFLGKSPAICDMVECGEFMVGLETSRKCDRNAISKKYMKDETKHIVVDTDGSVSWMSLKFWMT
jgi:hypothetical protein